jgi:hypothetical protein
LRGPARYLIPIFVIAYIAPFVTARDGIARLRGRLGGPTTPTRPTDANGRTTDRAGGRPKARAEEPRRPEPKNVTPKEAPPPDARA